MTPLINARDAIALQSNDQTIFVDATWYMPNVPKIGRYAFEKKRIRGAVFYDIDEVADPNNELPHMYPDVARFQHCVGNLGISKNSSLIIYDRSKYVASARAWWMFKSFGHPDVRVLNGGLQAWVREGGPTETGSSNTVPCSYTAQAPGDAIIEWGEVVDGIGSDAFSLLDARSAGRFNGTDPEPRPDLRGGHMPGSRNLYYGDVIDDNGMIKEGYQIADMLDQLNTSNDRPIVTTCGSGVTASILLLAIYQIRQSGLRLYDGSWTEWALNPKSPQ